MLFVTQLDVHSIGRQREPVDTSTPSCRKIVRVASSGRASSRWPSRPSVGCAAQRALRTASSATSTTAANSASSSSRGLRRHRPRRGLFLRRGKRDLPRTINGFCYQVCCRSVPREKRILFHAPVRALRDEVMFALVPSHPFGHRKNCRILSLPSTILALSFNNVALTLAMSNLLFVCLHNKHAVFSLECHPRKGAEME